MQDTMLFAEAQGLAPQLTALRRALHRCPEPARREEKTAALLAQQLGPFGTQAAVFFFHGMERGQPTHDEQQQQGHEQTGNHTAEVDPHIPHGRSAARHIQLDGFI